MILFLLSISVLNVRVYSVISNENVTILFRI